MLTVNKLIEVVELMNNLSLKKLNKILERTMIKWGLTSSLAHLSDTPALTVHYRQPQAQPKLSKVLEQPIIRGVPSLF